MTFDTIVHAIPEWLKADGPEAAIVISSRARLARNVKGIPYAHRADEQLLGEVIEQIADVVPDSGFDSSTFFRNDDLNDNQRHVFIERHLISNALASKTGNRGVLVADGETKSILINEEDHLRLQSFRSGFDPMSALEDTNDIDDHLSRIIEFSFSKDYGYLTACPTNMGTGLRASVLIHLPALVFTGEIQRVIRSTAQLGMAVRGYLGEGSDVVGNLFQISNQRSMGKKEHDIVEALNDVVAKIIDYEKRAAEMLIKEAESQTQDKIWRSIGILKTARMLSTQEFMNLSSAMRLGILTDIIDKKYLPTLNELMVFMQPAHLQEIIGGEADSHKRDAKRADLVRERFIDVRL